MHGPILDRSLRTELSHCLETFPAVAVLGPRQCGKSTLAKAFLAEISDSVYLDLERPSDQRQLTDPELYFDAHRDDLVCLDEIQRAPNLFEVLRGVIDERNRPGQFLVLGSASRDLIRQSSETLAGRIAFLELTPFLWPEVREGHADLRTYHLRGGFPPSTLAPGEADSLRWRRNFVRTFLERDLPQLGVQIPAETLSRLWTMCAHVHGQLLNQSQLGGSLGVSHTTVRSHLDLLSQTFMLRLLPPLLPNLGKRLVKSPKLYLRDTGLLHALLDIDTYDDLLGHPMFGASWEGLVLENVIAAAPDWRPHYFRTANGAELDLVLERGRRRLALECKASRAPKVTKGFWNALEDVEPEHTWVVALVEESYPLAEGVEVTSLDGVLDGLTAVG